MGASAAPPTRSPATMCHSASGQRSTSAGINLVSVNAAANWATRPRRAGLTLTTKEYLILRSVLGIVFAALVVHRVLELPNRWRSRGLPLGFRCASFWVNRRIGSRLKKLESQIVELLQMVSSGLRAGFGLSQALEAAAEQLPAPLSIEIQRTLARHLRWVQASNRR